MSFRFRRSIRVMPGVRLNISKSGISTSVGERGAHVTVGHGRVRESVGIPGTGLSWSESHRVGDEKEDAQPPSQSMDFGRKIILVLLILLFALPPIISWLIRH